MANFDFKIYHRPGSLNGVADALSRRSDLRENDRPTKHDAVLRRNPDGSLRYNQPRLAKVATVAKGDEPDNRTKVPEGSRHELIKELHESKEWGHLGIEKTIRRISNEYSMPNVQRTVTEAIGDYLACAKNKPKRHKPYGLLQPLTPPARLWISVTMDFIVKLPKSREPGSERLCDSILVIVDRLTKASKFVPTEESITAGELAYEVTRALFADHGILEQFITDRDKLFTSAY